MTAPQDKECMHCEQPIRKFYAYKGAPGVWMHLDGHRAYPECRYLKATPKEGDK